LENLAYAGAFDSFGEFHRARYFYKPEGDSLTGLEKIIRYGNQYQASLETVSNSLFGDTVMPEAPPPVIPDCEPWELTTLLEYEKAVTGMFMSGHPLDNFKFEMRHYNITPLRDFQEIKEGMNANGRNFRLAGLVIDAAHRFTKTGRQFGVFTLEDYTGKSEFSIWGDQFTKYANYLEKGKILFITGGFRPRFHNSNELEFKIDQLCLLESIKEQLTKEVQIDFYATDLNKDWITFLEENVRSNPGKTSLKINITDPVDKHKITLYSMGRNIRFNDNLADWMSQNPEISYEVLTS